MVDYHTQYVSIKRSLQRFIFKNNDNNDRFLLFDENFKTCYLSAFPTFYIIKALFDCKWKII